MKGRFALLIASVLVIKIGPNPTHEKVENVRSNTTQPNPNLWSVQTMYLSKIAVTLLAVCA